MEYYYTRKQSYIQGSIKKAIVVGLILLAVLISYSGRASIVGGCGLITSISSANVSCYGGNDGSATVMVTGGTAPYSYSWNSTPVQSTATAIALPAGTYTVTVTDTTGCFVTDTVVITQPAAPLGVSITAIDPGCANNDGTATATVTGGTGSYSYSWNTVPAQTSATATGLAGGSYSVTVTDANNCITTASVTLNTTAVTASITGPDTICQDPTYPFTITLHATGGTSYQWSNGSTSSATLSTPTATTTYSVVVSNGTCSDTAYFTVTVFLIPHAWVSGPSSACPGDTVMLTAHGGASFMWNTGETSSTLSANPMVNTTYTVVVTNGVCNDTVTYPVSVNAPVRAIQGCATPCANTIGMAYKIDVSGATTYNWTVPSDWTITSGQNTGSIMVNVGDVSADGNITVATTGGECATVNLQLAVDVKECSDELSIPNAFTPNDDGHNDTWEIANIKNYPDNEVYIINRWGNEVHHVYKYDNNWDGNGLEEGTYFYVVKVQASDRDDTGCALETTKELVYKGYVMIIREK